MNSLLNMWFKDISSHSLFILSIIPFVDCGFSIKAKHFLLTLESPNFPFSFKGLTLLYFTFKSVINFEFLYEVWELDWSSFFLLIDVQLLYYHLLKRLSFLHWIAFSSLSTIFSANLYELSVLFQWSIHVSLHQDHTVYYCSVVI